MKAFAGGSSFRLPCLVGLAFIAFGCGTDQVATSQSSTWDGGRFLNIAHRGGARLAPEHTVAAYRNGLAVGADVIEFDLHATSDGVVVVMHDETVDRTTDGSGAIKRMTFAALRQLDAGYRFSRDGGQTFPWRGKGLTVPSLTEALEVVGNAPLSVEFKQRSPSIVAATLAAFEARRGLHDVVFVSFPSEPTNEVRQLAPGVRSAFTAAEMAELTLLTAGDISSYMPPARFVQPPKELVDAAFIERAHRLGLKVQAWTVNNRDEMCDLMKLNVDGLFTDDPATLEAVRRDTACAPML